MNLHFCLVTVQVLQSHAFRPEPVLARGGMQDSPHLNTREDIWELLCELSRSSRCFRILFILPRQSSEFLSRWLP
jgi:hypothetical protein